MRLRSLHFPIGVAVALLSCAEPAPVVDKHPLAPTPPPIAPVDGGVPQTVALLESPDAGVDAGDSGTGTAEKKSIDPGAWLAARDVSDADRTKFENAWNCEEQVVAGQHEVALVCTTVEDVTRKTGKFPLDRMLEHRTVNVVRAKKVVSVLDVIVALTPLDKESDDGDIVDLGLHFSADGSIAKLDEHTELPGTRCAAAREENRKELQEGGTVVQWASFDRDLIARVCSAIGEFAWNEDHYVRSGKPR